MIMRLNILKKYKLKIHDVIFTLAYLLVILSLPPMINSLYFALIFHGISSLIFIHSLLGIVVIVLGFLFVINKGRLKIKRKWKNKRNMQILEALWLINFMLGTYLLAGLLNH